MWKVYLLLSYILISRKNTRLDYECLGSTLTALLFFKMPEVGPTVKKCHLSSHFFMLEYIITNNLSNSAYIPMSIHLHYWSL